MKNLDVLGQWLKSHLSAENTFLVALAVAGGLNGSRQQKGWQRTLNALTGATTASLSGLALSEAGYAIWLTCFLTYLIGNVGNLLMNGLINFIRYWEKRPFSFLGRVIILIGKILDLLIKAALLR